MTSYRTYRAAAPFRSQHSFSRSNPISTMKNIYIGPFVHSLSLKKLEVCPDGAIGVDESGFIAFVERDGSRHIEAIRAREGWKDAKLHHTTGRGFYIPGFIGMCNLFARCGQLAATIYLATSISPC